MEIKLKWEFVTPETKKEEKKKFENKEEFLLAYTFGVPMYLKIQEKYHRIKEVLDFDFINNEGKHLILFKIKKDKGYTIKSINAAFKDVELYY